MPQWLSRPLFQVNIHPRSHPQAQKKASYFKKWTWFSFVSQCCLWFNLPLPQFWCLSLPLLSLPLLSLPCLSVPLLSLPVTKGEKVERGGRVRPGGKEMTQPNGDKYHKYAFIGKGRSNPYREFKNVQRYLF